MTAPGTQLFTYFQTGKEATAGTSVAATRTWFPTGTGQWGLDRMRTRAEGANRGTRTNIVGATQQGVTMDIPFATDTTRGVSYNELVFPFSQLKGAQTGAGGSADKTWTFTPNQTSANSPENYTIEVGDDIQEYEAEFCFASGFTISAGPDDMTQLAVDWHGRQSTKSTKTSLTSNLDVTIPGYLWTVKFATAQSGLAGASISSNFLRSFSLKVDTGIRRRFYQDGNAYFGQTVEAMPIGFTLDLVVESTALAVSEFYDKAAADTIDFIRLKATGPVLGSSFYSAQIDLAVSYDDPAIIGAEDEGVNLYDIHSVGVYDPTWTNSIVGTIVCAIAALTA